METLIVVAVALLPAGAVAWIGSLLVLRNAINRVQELLTLRDRQEALEVRQEVLDTSWRTTATELQAYCEQLDDLAETIERKRRRIAARQSKETQPEPQHDPTNRDDLIRLARSQGHSV